MDQNDVATSIVSISTPGIWFGDVQAARTLARKCNEYSAQLVRDHPGRSNSLPRCLCHDTDGSLREIAYALDVLKADGICLLTSYGDRWPGDPAYAHVVEELNRRKAVVYVHPTGPDCCRDLVPDVPHVFTELPHDTTRVVTSLLFSGAFARFRDIRFIFSHAGGTLPMVAGRIARQCRAIKKLAERRPNGVEYELKRLHYEIAGSKPSRHVRADESRPDLPNNVRERLLVGKHRRERRGLTNLGLAAADLRAIGRENAIALFSRLRT